MPTYSLGAAYDAAMASIDMVWEYWESGQYYQDANDTYACGCCTCCGCSCSYDDVPEEFCWWPFVEPVCGVEDPSLDGSTRGTTAFAVRRRSTR